MPKRIRRKIDYDFYKSLLDKDKFYCKSCKKIKSIENFNIRKSSTLGYRFDCKKCQSRLTVLARNKKINSSKENYYKQLLKGTLRRAKVKKFKYNLTPEYILKLDKYQKGLCKLTKEKLSYLRGRGHLYHNASIDRINSKKGYVKGNIRILSYICNGSISNFKMSDVKKYAKLVVKHI